MRILVPAAVLCLLLTGCNGIDLGDNPSPDVAKQQGPLTVPPPLQTPQQTPPQPSRPAR